MAWAHERIANVTQTHWQQQHRVNEVYCYTRQGHALKKENKRSNLTKGIGPLNRPKRSEEAVNTGPKITCAKKNVRRVVDYRCEGEMKRAHMACNSNRLVSFDWRLRRWHGGGDIWRKGRRPKERKTKRAKTASKLIS